VNCPEVIYHPRIDATPETELSALTAVYRYVLFGSQARRGDLHDLTNSSSMVIAENGPQKTEREKT